MAEAKADGSGFGEKGRRATGVARSAAPGEWGSEGSKETGCRLGAEAGLRKRDFSEDD